MWKDMWLDQILATSHPRAFSFALNEDISVREFLGSTGLVAAFHLPLSMQAFEEVRDLQSLTVNVGEDETTGDDDTWTYIWDSGRFSARQYYIFYFQDV